MTEILDVSRDKETGEITQFLILGDSGQPDTKIASPENLLLYDPEDELPFEGGMNEFLSGDSALRVSEDPMVVVGQAGDEYSYILNVGGSVVETTPEQADTLLKGVYDAIADDDTSILEQLHKNIMANQVRRSLINVLAQTYEQRDRIEIVQNGWLVDGFYLVDWNAKMYAANDDREEGDYVRSGSDTVQKDTTYELVRLKHSISDADCADVVVDGDEYTLSEREMLFLSKIKWLLYRRHYHPDKPFWYFADQWADVEVETGLPEMDDEEPNLDVFDI